MRLTARQNIVLAALGQHGPCGTHKLAELLSSSKQSAATTAGSLCDRELAHRIPGLTTGRTFYELTEKGRAYLAEEVPR